MKRSAPRRVGIRRTVDSKTDKVWKRTREEVILRDGGCVARRYGLTSPCWGGPHVHHKARRSQGGTDTPDNLLTLCAGHHGYVHEHPAWAIDVGLLTIRRAADTVGE